MCGIAGYIGTKIVDDAKIGRTMQAMLNRGPDHQNFARCEIGNGRHAVLLSSRLAIVDLDPRSNMPLSKAGLTIVFNGEIYNHEQLRSELIALGESFTSTSDTEVLLVGIRRFGPAFLDRAEGMWAFALFDGRTNEVLLSRDRFGEKPLFLYRTSHGIFFGSETKFIKALSGDSFAPNMEQVMRYVVNGYRSIFKSDQSWIAGITELPSAHTLRISAAGAEATERYWSLPQTSLAVSESEAIQLVREAVISAVRFRLRADVPVACCLSGGMDSAAIASIATKIARIPVTTFSIIDDNPDYNEQSNIDAILKDLGCVTHQIKVPKSGFLERLMRLVEYHEGPLATISYYIHSFLSEKISSTGFRVSLSGTGSDEIFSGYYDHYLLHMAEMLKEPELEALKSDWTTHVLPRIRNPHYQRWDLFVENPQFRKHLFLHNPAIVTRLKTSQSFDFQERNYGRSLLRNRMLNELFEEVVPPIVREDDLNSMLWSVENRSPFLDRKLVELLNSLPSKYLIKNGYQKYLLRMAMDGIVVDKVRLDRRKVGFNASVTDLMDCKSDEVRNLILKNNPLEQYIDLGGMRELLSRDKLTNQESQQVFGVVGASIFLRTF